LLMLAGQQLDALLRPECCVIYGQAEDAYVPVFVRGNVLPPTFAAHSPVIAALQAGTTPVEVEPWRRTAKGKLGPDERMTLDSLGAVVLLPVSRGESLTAFIGLGP